MYLYDTNMYTYLYTFTYIIYRHAADLRCMNTQTYRHTHTHTYVYIYMYKYVMYISVYTCTDVDIYLYNGGGSMMYEHNRTHTYAQTTHTYMYTCCQEKLCRLGNMQNIYNALDILSGTAWTINDKMLRTIQVHFSWIHWVFSELDLFGFVYSALRHTACSMYSAHHCISTMMRV